jgi:hypothetical protein
MKFKGTLTSFEIDMKDYRNRLHARLSEEVARLAFAWINTVLDEIPTWSGASRATFMQLAGKIRFNLSISPKVASRIGFGTGHGTGSINSDSQRGVYTFKYSTDLRWLVSNEFNHNTAENDSSVFHRLKKPGPYHFQRKGLATFEREVKDVRLPSPWKSLKLTKHRVR